MAPELLREDPIFTKKVDIWGLGCILYELACFKKAFSGYGSIREYATSGNSFVIPVLPFDKYSGILLADMIHDFLTPDPKQRPSASTILQGLRKNKHHETGMEDNEWMVSMDRELLHVQSVSLLRNSEIHKASFHLMQKYNDRADVG